jgi:hypothetical protein
MFSGGALFKDQWRNHAPHLFRRDVGRVIDAELGWYPFGTGDNAVAKAIGFMYL